MNVAFIYCKIKNGDGQGVTTSLFLALIIFLDIKSLHLFPIEKERQDHQTLQGIQEEEGKDSRNGEKLDSRDGSGDAPQRAAVEDAEELASGTFPLRSVAGGMSNIH
ncbi:uncharacterized protein [Macaca nemestrina]|uniref:uncharacterized protein n=1 Tax=Macaca nemestrina TaxID=9545 RepID=UPI0000D9C056|nr:uncharacterized protein LOC105497261 [Macaca nemestrina]